MRLMLFRRIAAVMAAVLVLSGVGSRLAWAEVPVIGVVDVQRVLAEADAAKKAVEQRERYANGYQTSTATEEKGLRAEDEELARLRATLPADEFTKRRVSFQNKVVEFQKKVQTRRHNLERSFAQAMNAVNAEVIRATDAIASERGLTLVLYRSQVFLFDPKMDITNDVMARVNRALPTVTLANPDTLGADDDADSAKPASGKKNGG